MTFGEHSLHERSRKMEQGIRETAIERQLACNPLLVGVRAWSCHGPHRGLGGV